MVKLKRIERLDKKELERRYLANFREAFADFPAGSIESDRESPDFVVVASDSTVGIELKRLFRPDLPEHGSLRAQESLMFMIANQALSIYETRKPPLVDVHILFDRPRLRKSDVARYAKVIAALVEHQVQSGEGVNSESIDEGDERLRALPGVARIHIMRGPAIKEDFFAPSMAAVRPYVGIDYVQAAINSKNVKLPQYKSRCTEFWLLLAYGREGLPATMSFTNDVFTHTFQSAFRRVFLFGWQEELDELSVRAD